jgi:hypothetical protein
LDEDEFPCQIDVVPIEIYNLPPPHTGQYSKDDHLFQPQLLDDGNQFLEIIPRKIGWGLFRNSKERRFAEWIALKELPTNCNGQSSP